MEKRKILVTRLTQVLTIQVPFQNINRVQCNSLGPLVKCVSDDFPFKNQILLWSSIWYHFHYSVLLRMAEPVEGTDLCVGASVKVSSNLLCPGRQKTEESLCLGPGDWPGDPRAPRLFWSALSLHQRGKHSSNKNYALKVCCSHQTTGANTLNETEMWENGVAEGETSYNPALRELKMKHKNNRLQL